MTTKAPGNTINDSTSGYEYEDFLLDKLEDTIGNLDEKEIIKLYDKLKKAGFVK